MAVDQQTLRALRLAAKLVLEYTDEIDGYNSQALDILEQNCPGATVAVVAATQRRSIKIRKDLDSVWGAFDAAGIDEKEGIDDIEI